MVYSRCDVERVSTYLQRTYDTGPMFNALTPGGQTYICCEGWARLGLVSHQVGL